LINSTGRTANGSAKERLAEFLGLAPRGGHWHSAINMPRQNSLIEVKDDQLRLATEFRGHES
jgi:hypothetical protein